MSARPHSSYRCLLLLVDGCHNSPVRLPVRQYDKQTDTHTHFASYHLRFAVLWDHAASVGAERQQRMHAAQ